MRTRFKIVLFFLVLGLAAQAQFVQPMGYKDYSFPWQVNIGNGSVKQTATSAYFEIGNAASTKGFLGPRGSRFGIGSPAYGLQIFDNGRPYWFNGSAWVTWGDSTGSGGSSGSGPDSLYLSGLLDVQLGTLASGHLIRWDATLQRWVNFAPNYVRYTDTAALLAPYATRTWITAQNYFSANGPVDKYVRGNGSYGDFDSAVQVFGDTRYLQLSDTTLFQGATDTLKFIDGLVKLNNEVKARYGTAMWNANRLQGYLIRPGQPNHGSYLRYDAINGMWFADTTGDFEGSGLEADPLSVHISDTAAMLLNYRHWNAGYLTSFTETDPVFGASIAAGITGADTTNWNNAYRWGNHSLAGYLTSYTETDPLAVKIADSAAMLANYRHWNAGYLTSYTETDPLYTANGVAKTTTLTINGTAYDLSADRSWTIDTRFWNPYNQSDTLTGNPTVTMNPSTGVIFQRKDVSSNGSSYFRVAANSGGDAGLDWHVRSDNNIAENTAGAKYQEFRIIGNSAWLRSGYAWGNNYWEQAKVDFNWGFSTYDGVYQGAMFLSTQDGITGQRLAHIDIVPTQGIQLKVNDTTYGTAPGLTVLPNHGYIDIDAMPNVDETRWYATVVWQGDTLKWADAAPAGGGGGGGTVNTSGVQTGIAGSKYWTDGNYYADTVQFSGGAYFNGGPTGAAFMVRGSSFLSSTNALWQFGGATTMEFNVASKTAASLTPTVGAGYASFLMARQQVNEAASGTHPFIAQLALKPVFLVNNASTTTTNSATLYIEDATQGTATVDNKYALWVDAGLSRFDGQISLPTSFTPSSATDATHPIGTIAADDTYLWRRNSAGNWTKIAWAAY